jgi:hypothetical protein
LIKLDQINKTMNSFISLIIGNFLITKSGKIKNFFKKSLRKSASRVLCNTAAVK